ncbi:MAG: phenylalanine--tRNA ligase subunit beta, partial [Candidatus Hydrogenedentes bacterium]|nr:phenylalanine--tRNA ligase subunit beta [Candidatus Hydrogenedentota bacterium]
MKIPLNWLKEYIDLDVGVDELCEKMTMLGLEIESVERPGADIQQVVVGEILSIEPHPGADKLVVCKTNVGADEPVQIVCGASNMKVGDKVPTALVGGTLPGGFKIGKRKMRGVESQGMMCS